MLPSCTGQTLHQARIKWHIPCSHLGATDKAELLTIFNMSLEAGSPPTPWKVASITQIPKPKDLGTMRPISLLSCAAKILDRMVLDRLKWQVGELHPHLFAFQSRRNTTTCLMILLGALRSRSSLVFFLDLEKAFEVANPSAILEALAEKGVRGCHLQWLEGFLTGPPLHPAASHLGHPAGQPFQPIYFQRID